jgi:hypothetical protein
VIVVWLPAGTDDNAVPASAVVPASTTQSEAEIGQLAAPSTHDPIKLRPSELTFPTALIVKVAELICALSGRLAVLNRTSPSKIWYCENTFRFPTVKYTPVVYGEAVPLGGQPPLVAARTPTSPSSPLAATGNETVTGWLEAAATGPTAADCADADPAPLLAVTTTRTNDPTFPLTGVYDDPVAPAISVNGPDAEPPDCHLYAYESGAVPDQVPFAAVSACPTDAVPLIVGAAWFAGAAAAITEVVAEFAVGGGARPA